MHRAESKKIEVDASSLGTKEKPSKGYIYTFSTSIEMKILYRCRQFRDCRYLYLNILLVSLMCIMSPIYAQQKMTRIGFSARRELMPGYGKVSLDHTSERAVSSLDRSALLGARIGIWFDERCD